jgi:hypothetical protein
MAFIGISTCIYQIAKPIAFENIYTRHLVKKFLSIVKIFIVFPAASLHQPNPIIVKSRAELFSK